MKALFGIIGAVITLLFLKLLVDFAFIPINEWMKGWLCCTGFFAGIEIYKIRKG